MSEDPATRPFMDYGIYTTNGVPRSFVSRCVLFSEEQATLAFSQRECPDMALVVKDGRCQWVTTASAAITFFREGGD